MSWQGKKVLIVDDMKHAQNEISTAYQDLGLSVVGFAENGLEALEKIEELKPDLISLDLIMPEMDGVECLQLIRKRFNPQLPIIVISYLVSEPKAREALHKYLAEEVLLPKTFSRPQLIKALSSYFGEDPNYKNTVQQEIIENDPLSQQESLTTYE